MAQTAAWKQPFHQARRWVAKQYLQFYPHLMIIGVTGSYGKTSTARAIAALLSEKFKTLQTDLNLDTVYNLPLTLLRLRPGHRQLVLELGVDHRGEMKSYLQLVKPSIGVLTGITPVHSEPELLGSLEGIMAEKGSLLESLPESGLAILSKDDQYVCQMAKKTKARVVWYGLNNKADFWAEKIKVDITGTSFQLHSPKEKIVFKTGLIGRHFVQSCLAAAAVSRFQGLSWSEISQGFLKLSPLKGRISAEPGPSDSILINDALRANPPSTIAGLQVLADLPTKGKRIAVLGEMGELSQYAKVGHQEIGKKAAEGKIDCLVAVGPLQKFTAEAALKKGLKKENVFWVKDVKMAANVLKKILKKGDLLYLKGSLLRHMERVLLILNNQKVGCHVTSCHFYRQCSSCPHLKKGLE